MSPLPLAGSVVDDSHAARRAITASSRYAAAAKAIIAIPGPVRAVTIPPATRNPLLIAGMKQVRASTTLAAASSANRRDRQSVVKGKRVYVSVDLGGRVIIHTQQRTTT